MIVVIAVASNLFAYAEIQRITSLQLIPGEYQVRVKEYASGSNFDIVDAAVLEELQHCISEIQYKGIFLGDPFITQEEPTYSLIICSKDIYCVFIVSESSSRVMGQRTTISIKNDEALYQFLQCEISHQNK